MFKVTRKIKECRIAILEWRKKVQGNSKVRIMELKEKLNMEREGNEVGKSGRIAELKSKLSKAYKEKELYWSQKSRSTWLKEGDRNTAYFHTSVMAKKRRNTISTLQKRMGLGARMKKRLRRN